MAPKSVPHGLASFLLLWLALMELFGKTLGAAVELLRLVGHALLADQTTLDPARAARTCASVKLPQLVAMRCLMM